ncbi:MAG: cation-transporting P-type ATPase [Bryobacterales bacterium]|nr:cation-transporting P-type ATPase [Bryobacterales bacterium]
MQDPAGTAVATGGSEGAEAHVWHHLPASEVLSLVESDLDRGISPEEAALRLEKFGHNILTQKKGHGPLVRFLLQFHQPLIYILLAATVITALLQEWVDSGVIFGVVLVNAVIGFLQESKAVNAIEALARAMTSEATVLRGGARKRIASQGVVPGDIVLLQSGDKVPADVRLLRTRELQIDESALTGESVPVQKKTGELDAQTGLADRGNMAYSSALVTHGTGTGVVIATGDRTELGRISELIASTDVLATPLTKKIAHFSGLLLWIILGLAALTFVVGILRGMTWLDMFMAAVALAVGAIPEGLPAAMTITLAIGVSRMAQRHAIIRKLPAVETLGSTTVICSDKTGTLTQNQMTVREALAGGGIYRISGGGYSPDGEILPRDCAPGVAENLSLLECLKAGVLCNESRLHETEEGWRIEGDPTEGALLTSSHKAGLLAGELHDIFPRVDTIPFESEHQYMATLHDMGDGKPRNAYLKGSFERILASCGSALEASGERGVLDRSAIQKHVEAMASRGLRVLAFARKELPPGQDSLSEKDVAEDLEFLGLQGMIDPPRPEAIAAVKACQTAGMKVKMITGDHVGTALAIAEQLGINGASSKREALTGSALADLSDQDLIGAVERTSVFARVTPEQKLRLVQALQARGHVVAMTGDGVNDAPALRRADIGVAMGIAGTEVAKDASDMILTDDNFASIEAAVEEGRGVFDNLVKFITWTLPTNIGEGLLILVAIFAGVTLPILPVQILWINMTTAVLLGLMLAFEPKEPGIMQRKPRDPDVPILTPTLQWRIALVSALLLAGSFGLFNWELDNGATIEQARTVAINVFVMGELFYLFNCRSLTQSMFKLGVFSNWWVIGGVTAMILLQIVFTYMPWMNAIFSSEPIGMAAWMRVTAVGLVIYGVIGFEKWLRLRSSGSRA